MKIKNHHLIMLAALALISVPASVNANSDCADLLSKDGVTLKEIIRSGCSPSEEMKDSLVNPDYDVSCHEIMESGILNFFNGAQKINCSFDHLPIIGPFIGDPLAEDPRTDAIADGYDDCHEYRDQYWTGSQYVYTYKIYYEVGAWSAVSWDEEGFVDWSLSGNIYGDYSGGYRSGADQYYDSGKSLADGDARYEWDFSDQWTTKTVHVTSGGSVSASSSNIDETSSRSSDSHAASYQCFKAWAQANPQY
jgi:hypothetical protein